MKKLFENFRNFINEVEKLVCPPATQDVDINTKNRNSTRQNHMYGPLNVNEPGDYWQKLAQKWRQRKKQLENQPVAFALHLIYLPEWMIVCLDPCQMSLVV